MIGGFFIGKMLSMWRNHKILTISVVVMLGTWALAGWCLYVNTDDNFWSNFFNAGSAIGSVGAVITSLCLSNKTPKIDIYAVISPATENDIEEVFLNVTNTSDIPIRIYSIDVYLPNNKYIRFDTKHNLFNPFESKPVDFGLISTNLLNDASFPYNLELMDHLLELSKSKGKLKASVYSSLGRQIKTVRVINK